LPGGQQEEIFSHGWRVSVRFSGAIRVICTFVDPQILGLLSLMVLTEPWLTRETYGRVFVVFNFTYMTANPLRGETWCRWACRSAWRCLGGVV
jgi:hypothetical protein